MSLGDFFAIAGFPLVVLGYIEAFTKWGPKIRNIRQPLGYILLALGVIAYVWDVGERINAFGIFGPTKENLQSTIILQKRELADMGNVDESDTKQIKQLNSDNNSLRLQLANVIELRAEKRSSACQTSKVHSVGSINGTYKDNHGYGTACAVSLSHDVRPSVSGNTNNAGTYNSH